MSSLDAGSLRYCFSSLGCPELDFNGVIALAREFKFPHVELRALENTVELPKLFQERFGSPEAFAKKVAGTGIGIASLDTSLKLMENNEAERQEFLAFLPWAEALGGVSLRAFDGKGETEEAGWDAAEKTMAWWEAERSKAGWKSTIIVETHDSAFTRESISRLMKMAPDSVGLLWDSHHTWKRGGEDPVELWGEVKQWTRHIHFKDSVSKPSARHPFTYVELGTGEFPLKALINTLAEAGFAGPMSLEWEKMWHPYLSPLKDALATGVTRGWW